VQNDFNTLEEIQYVTDTEKRLTHSTVNPKANLTNKKQQGAKSEQQ
jgi:hypothetical protein